MTNRRVRFTVTALEHVRREKAWWIENRDHPDVFADELERVIEILSALPGIGSRYDRSPVAGVRRVYMRRAAVHVYYSFDQREVLIRAVWGARREHGPEITSDQA